MYRHFSHRLSLGLKSPIANDRRSIITGPTRTGSGASSQRKVAKVPSAGEGKKESGSWRSIFDASFVFNLFLVVGAMGAGYTLGKTTILTAPPATLFPAQSTTPYATMAEYEKEDKERESKQYDMFRRCILRILESKGIEVDMKNGQNESLYEQKYCSRDISEIMNDADSLSNVFFGRDPKEWEGKQFVWYPQNTQDTATIMKFCDEFKVPVSTGTSGIDPTGLGFQINFRDFAMEQQDGGDVLRFGLNVSGEDLNRALGEKGFGHFSNRGLRPLDLFLLHSGVKLSDSDGRLIANRFDADAVDGIECVLPDGEVLEVRNSNELPDDYKLYRFLVPFQEQVCVITRVLFARERPALPAGRPEEPLTSLVVVGSNDLGSLTGAIQDIRQRVGAGRAISLVDSHGCARVADTYGPYGTFAVLKAGEQELAKLRKKLGGSADVCFQQLDIDSIATPAAAAVCYFSASSPSGDDGAAASGAVLLVQDDVADEHGAIRAYRNKTPAAESEALDRAGPSVKRDLLRKIKLAVDSGRVLNRNAGIAVSPPASSSTS